MWTVVQHYCVHNVYNVYIFVHTGCGLYVTLVWIFVHIQHVNSSVDKLKFSSYG